MKRPIIVLLLGIYFSVSGQTWTRILDNVSGSDQWNAIASSADGTTLVAAAGTGPIMVSTNSGFTWIQATNAPVAEWFGVACSADGKIQVAVAGENGGGPICASTNRGATWNVTQAPNNHWTGVACSADGTRILAAGGLIYASTNAGATWVPTSLTFLIGQPLCVACSADGEKLIAGSGSWGDPIYISTNFGSTWVAANTASNSFWTSVAASSNGMTLIAAGGHMSTSYLGENFLDSVVCASSDGGVTWTTNIIDGTLGLGFLSTAASADGSKLVAVGPITDSTIYLSTDFGATFAVMPDQPSPQSLWVAAAFSADGSQLVVADGIGPIFKARYLPSLSIFPCGKYLNVSWPAIASSSGLFLRRNLDLGSTNWQTFPTDPLFTNGSYSMMLSPTNAQEFFRLENQ